MTGEGSSKQRSKKKKRGKSLIFKFNFHLPGTSNDDNKGGKALASDDNLVYCDDTGKGIAGDDSHAKTNSSSSRRGRVSSIFKAVLFDTALKKRMPSKNDSDHEPDHEPTEEFMTHRTTESTNVSINEKTSDPTRKSPVLYEKTENDSFNTNIDNAVKVPEADDGNTSTNNSNVVPLSPKTDASVVASSTVDDNSQKPTDKRVMTRVNSKKKPPLPSAPRSNSVKRYPKQDSEPATLNNPTSRFCFYIALVVLVSLFLWMRFTTNETKSSDIGSGQLTDVVDKNEL